MTKSEIYAAAENMIRQRKSAALIQQEEREKKIYAAIPEISEIRKHIVTESRKIVMIISDGGNPNEAIQEQKKAIVEAQHLICSLLQNHGYPADYLEVRYYCSDCKDSGYIGDERCHCFNEIVKNIAAKDMNRNAQVKLCGFSTFSLDYYTGEERTIMEHIYSKAQDFVCKFGNSAENMIMLGDTGLGKTHLSLSIANAVIEKGYCAIYDTTMNILKKIECEHFSRYNDDEALSAVLNCDLLVIDDLGTEFLTPFYASVLFNIIDTRINTERSTVISTNLSLKEIESHYGKRISSRINGSYICLKFCGKDIRLQKKLNEISARKRNFV